MKNYLTGAEGLGALLVKSKQHCYKNLNNIKAQIFIPLESRGQIILFHKKNIEVSQQQKHIVKQNL